MEAFIAAALVLLVVFTYTFFADAPRRRPAPPRRKMLPDGYRGFTLADADEDPEAMPPEPGTYGTGPR